MGTVGRLVVKCLQRGHKAEVKRLCVAARVRRIGLCPRLLKPSGLRLHFEVVKTGQKHDVQNVKSKSKKPSPAQLKARANFAKMAKERAKGKGNIGKGKRPEAIKEPARRASSLRSFKLKKARPLKTRATRQYVSGPPSMQDDINKVSMRGPRLQLEAMDESKFEIDVNGSFSKMGF